MVDHQAGLAAVDADILAGDETSLVGSQEQHHVGDIQGIAHPAHRLLDGVGAFVDGVVGVDPAGADGIDPDFSSEADCQRVGQGGDAALGGGVAFGLGLAHAVPGRGDVDDACSRCEIGGEQLGQVEGGGDTDGERLLEFLVSAGVDALKERRRIVHQHIHPAIFINDRPGEILQHILPGNVAHIMIAGNAVDDANMRTLLFKFFCDALANTTRTAGDDDNFVFEHRKPPVLEWKTAGWSASNLR